MSDLRDPGGPLGSARGWGAPQPADEAEHADGARGTDADGRDGGVAGAAGVASRRDRRLAGGGYVGDGASARGRSFAAQVGWKSIVGCHNSWQRFLSTIG